MRDVAHYGLWEAQNEHRCPSGWRGKAIGFLSQWQGLECVRSCVQSWIQQKPFLARWRAKWFSQFKLSIRVFTWIRSKVTPPAINDPSEKKKKKSEKPLPVLTDNILTNCETLGTCRVSLTFRHFQGWKWLKSLAGTECTAKGRALKKKAATEVLRVFNCFWVTFIAVFRCLFPTQL